MNDFERELFARELETFVPPRILDAHCHWWTASSNTTDRGGMTALPTQTGRQEYLRLMKNIVPERQVGALAIPMPWAPDTAAESRWLGEQTDHGGSFASAVMIAPEDDPDQVRELVKSCGASALKCYHSFASREPTWQADIPEYLPEPIVEVANDEGLAIVLHLVKDRGPADPSNIHWIRTYCTRYPDMHLVLAHSARAFQPQHAMEALPQLQDLPNLAFDCSANCEMAAHVAVMKLCGPERLMYGSDFPVSHLRGRSVAAADSFIWIYGDSPVWNAAYADIAPVLVGLEHLRSLKWACWSLGLSDPQIEGIFASNAQRILGLELPDA